MTVRARVTDLIYPRGAKKLGLNDFVICKCTAPAEFIPSNYRLGSEKNITFSAKGTGIPISKKFDVILDGKWEYDDSPKHYGLTLKVKSADIAPPSDEEGVVNYLTMFLDGCSKASAKRIYKAFGQATIMILQDAPEKLYEVPQLRKASVAKMIESFKRTRCMVELAMLLSPYGIGKRRIENIYNKFGPDSAALIKENPFILQDVHGIGYETMDMLSNKFSAGLDSPLRIKAAVKYCIIKASRGTDRPTNYLFDDAALRNGGNLFLNQYVLRESARRLLNQRTEKQIAVQQITQVLWDMYNNSELLGESGNVYLPRTFCEERDCAKNIVSIISESSVKRYSGPQAENALLQAEKAMKIELSWNQRQAVLCVLANPMSVITGGAGTGKSTVLKVILEALRILGENPDNVVLAAPTGKAAIRMTECTDYPASTLHKALGMMNEDDYWLTPEDFTSLQANFVVVDEFSMVDMFLAYRLFSQIDLRTTRVLLVGDVGQLPSVGAGDVLNQIILSNVVPTVKLVTIFRQAAQSRIVQNSVHISVGNTEGISFGDDCFFIKGNNQDEILSQLLQTYFQQVQKYGIENTIVLSPVKGDKMQEQTDDKEPDSDSNTYGPEINKLGTNYINAQIQAMINPPAYNKTEVKIGGNIYRLGDKVIQLKNKTFKQESTSADSDTSDGSISVDVCNGDIGKIKSISKDSNGYCFYVEFTNNRFVKLDYEAILDIDLAYSLTIHKSQGSEYSSVVMPLYRNFPKSMLNRNLLYTAVTRAKKELYIIGDRSVMNDAIKNANVFQRNTLLSTKLQRYYEEERNESVTY